VPSAVALGRRNGGQPVTGGARVALGRQPAVRRRVLRRSCKPDYPRVPRALRARPAARPRRSNRPRGRGRSREMNAPSGARRAPRALENVKKVLTSGR
jgi:hypothetical protein